MKKCVLEPIRGCQLAKDRKLSSLDRAVAQALGEGKVIGRADDPAREKFPELWEWLSRVYIGKDRLKSPATLSISLGPEGVLIRLNDRDLATGCAAGAPFLEEAFAALESAMTGPHSNWTFWGKKEPQLKKRRIAD